MHRILRGFFMLCLLAVLPVEAFAASCPFQSEREEIELSSVNELANVLSYLVDDNGMKKACAAELADGSLKNSIVAISFSETMKDAETMPIALDMVLPSGLGGLEIDGALSGGAHFTFVGDGSDNPALRFSHDAADAPAQNTLPDITLRNLRVAKAKYGVWVDAKQSYGTRLTMDALAVEPMPGGTGVAVIKLYEGRAHFDDVTVAGDVEHGIVFAIGSLQSSALRDVVVDGAENAVSMTFMDTAVNGNRMRIERLLATNVDLGIHLMAGNYSNLNILSPSIQFNTIGIRYDQPGGNEDTTGLLIQDATLTGVGELAERCIDLEDGRFANKTQIVQIESSAPGATVLDNCANGVVIRGSFDRVVLRDVNMHNISSFGLSAVGNAVGRRPQRVGYKNVLFDAAVPVQWNTLFAGALTDSVYPNDGDVNAGIDTPPVAKPVLVQRSYDDPTYVMLNVPFFAGLADVSDVQLYHYDNGVSRPLAYNPSSIAANCEGAAVCNYMLELDLVEHGLDDVALDDLQFQVAFALDDNTTALSAPIGVVDADMLGTKVLTVDNATFHPANYACTDETAGDCTLLGALTHVDMMRADGEHNPVRIQFNLSDPRVFLSAPLTIGSDHVTIDGENSILLVADNTFLAGGDQLSLINIEGNDVTLRNLSLNPQAGAVQVVRVAPEVAIDEDFNVKLNDLTVRGVQPGRQVFTTPLAADGKLPFPEIRNLHVHDMPMDSVLLKVSGAEDGAGLRGAYVTNLQLSGDQLPVALTPGTSFLTPTLNSASIENWALRRFTLQGQYPTNVLAAGDSLDVYVHFANRPEVPLQFVGKYQPSFNAMDPTVFSVQVDLPAEFHKEPAATGMLSWGQMSFVVMRSVKMEVAPYPYLSSGFSNPVDLDVDLATLDSDGDGVLDAEDNCDNAANADQANHDGDASGDVCDSDDDNDGIPDITDNCELIASVNVSDIDLDGQGDVCDDDIDGDSVLNADDNCPFDANTDQSSMIVDGVECLLDSDKDSVADDNDNCPNQHNLDQSNFDGDEDGDACDADDDNDGINDLMDNCALAPNLEQEDLDGDGLGDLCDDDLDGDHVPNAVDNCHLIDNPKQEDANDNGVGDACDPIGVMIDPIDPGNPGDTTGPGTSVAGEPGELTGTDDPGASAGEEPPAAAAGGGGCGCRLAAENGMQRAFYRQPARGSAVFEILPSAR